MRRRGWLAAALVLLTATAAWAGWCPLSDRACGVEGLQSSVVEGLIRVESGGNPWALHVGIGRGYAFYPQTAGEARRFLAVSLALTTNVDIGLMQVNWRTWGEAARGLGLDPSDLLDPQTNLWMGCRILAEALSGPGSFEARLGRYHSWRPERGRWYAKLVLAAARELELEGSQ